MTSQEPVVVSTDAPAAGGDPGPRVLDPVLLRTFVAVAEAGTVTEAARRLRLVQSALTRHLQRLQRELGLGLFAPAGARLRLTPAGHACVRLHSRADDSPPEPVMEESKRSGAPGGDTETAQS